MQYVYICRCVTLWFVAPKMFEDFHNNENLDNDEDFEAVKSWS